MRGRLVAMSSGVVRAVEAIPESDRWGGLCLFGEWFGGRPMENHHTLSAVRSDANAVVLTFDGGETLTVWDPAEVSVSPEGLRIARASRVRWEWFYYGRPRLPENRFSLDYQVHGDTVAVTDTADWRERDHRPDGSADAVAFLRRLVD